MQHILRLFILLVGLFAGTGSYAADAAPKLTTPDDLGPQIEQPIEFPHFRHAGDAKDGGMQINCMYCHTYARRSMVAGIPPVQKCIGCHQSIESVRDKPRIQKLFEYWDAKKPIPWKKVHDLPDFVRFNHERHIQRFYFQQDRPYQEVCGYCHGNVKAMTVAQRQKPLTMGWCASCHQKDHPVSANSTETGHGPNDCFTCHK
ncbi:menaquinone reductase, multiheme cytochrome c subunit [Sideroxyarcus emersonii]|uniref:Menaquinone reductase, multiheme cytochrome c subunit n=1 Tax=Sideroxyarcus emersonii TaxID=2764705 RepID=A0AAN1X8L4_9PROT|nr:cytochrome c3 family protein [Sideroxyarcus emersonii]BCK86773.1 menaquinone reductase, multiheme cytochrome c subunit [Sideroxyarcus emersonii]